MVRNNMVNLFPLVLVFSCDLYTEIIHDVTKIIA